MGKSKKIGIAIGISAVVISLSLTVLVFSQQNIWEVYSGGMQPLIKPLDKIKFDPTIPFDSLGVGDIIIFYKPSDTRFVEVMRIVDISTDSQGERIITTKGDANPQPIPGKDFPITEKEYIGKFVEVTESPNTKNCSFENDDLLNYLRNPDCDPPEGIEVDQKNRCVFKLEQNLYVDAKCEESGKAWAQGGCLYLKEEDGQELGICP